MSYRSGMRMDADRAKGMIKKLLAEVQDEFGHAAVDRYSSLRDVDAKVREFRLLLEGIDGVPPSLLDNLAKDPDFSANSRRVRLEALANYARTTIKFLESGVFEPKKMIRPAPDLSKLTAIMPNLETSIASRWLEAQRCQHNECFLAAIILMGSILEGLLLARASLSPADAYCASCVPKDKESKARPIHDWTLSAPLLTSQLSWVGSRPTEGSSATPSASRETLSIPGRRLRLGLTSMRQPAELAGRC